MIGHARLSTIFRRTFRAFRADNATRSAAALSYYAIFSIVPMLLIVIAVSALVLGERAARTQVLDQLAGVLGTAAADAIREMLSRAAGSKAGVIASIVGSVGFLFGTTGVFVELRSALHAIWKRDARTTDQLSYSIVLAIGTLIIISLVLDGGITTLGAYAGHHLAGGQTLWKMLQLLLSIIVATALFATIFRFLARANVRWSEVLMGGAVTAFLFVLGKFALGMYLSKAAVGSSFGAAGSIIVVLVWVYWSALIFLFGAEFTHEYAIADEIAACVSIHGSLVARQSVVHDP